MHQLIESQIQRGKDNTTIADLQGQDLRIKRLWGIGLTTAGGGNFVSAFLNRNKRAAQWAVAPIEVAERKCGAGVACGDRSIGREMGGFAGGGRFEGVGGQLILM